MKFSASRKKVERAMKHIRDLNALLVGFSESDFYAVRVEEYKGRNHVVIDFRKQFPVDDAALIIGDALHNLRSALDIMYYQAFHETSGITDHRTKFPFRDEWEELVSAIDGGLKEKGLSDHPSAAKIRNVIVDVIQPHMTGNYPLWALHDMNITDKHQLLIPVFKIMRFTDIRLEDERGDIFLADGQPYFTEDSYRFKVGREGAIKVHDKGHAATAIVFDVAVPLKNKPVVPALSEIAESVTRAIDAFDNLGLHGFFD
jgi:hypothetical protein